MTEYKLGNTIEVNVDASNYDKLTIGIDKDGVGRVVTNTLWFTISAPQYTNFTVSKCVYFLGENVEIHIDASKYDGIAVRIDKDVVGCVVSKDVSARYVFSSNELGEGTYSVYMTAWTNGGQYVDTNRLWHFVRIS